jgi:hypothetical protein
MRRSNNLDLSGLTNFLNTSTDKIDTLQPLATTMSKALLVAGIQPPSELSNLAQSFHDNIVKPASGALSGNPTNNILDYVAKTVTAQKSGQPLSKVQSVVAAGGNQTLNNLSTQSFFGDLFSNPITWVVIVSLIAFALWLKYR